MLAKFIKRIESHVDSPWYPVLLALVAAADYFIFVIPLDGILITSILTLPKRWFRFSIATTLGSTFGATLFAYLIDIHGVSLIQSLSPGMMDSALWKQSADWITRYGSWAVFGSSVIPIMPHPLIAIGALTDIPVLHLFVAVLAGRILKYTLLSYLASHAPGMLSRFKWIQKEVKEVEDDLTKP